MDNRGFTIIELVMIILTAAILAAVAVPQFNRYWAGIKTGNAAMYIASDIRFAQNRATTTQQRSQINFSAGGTSYTIRSCAIADYAIGTCTCGGAGWTNIKVVDFSALTSEFSGVTIATVPTHCIEFDSLGRPYYNTNCSNPAAPCPSAQIIPQFNVQHSGSTRTISITTQTGMVSF
jgi:Tfp pilus assembly protein PilE